MTRIKYRARPVWHQTGLVYDGRAILVAESPVNLLIRRKGTRMVLQLSWLMAYLRAATVKADSIAKEKKRKRGTRGTRRGVFS